MHEYMVELRISGPTLHPDDVTRDLGIVPTQTRFKGERRDEKSLWGEGMWAIAVQPPSGESWISLEDGLRSLLELIGPKRSGILAYSASNKVYLWCGHFSSSFDGGPTLSSGLLKSLGEFGVELILDTYCSLDARGKPHA